MCALNIAGGRAIASWLFLLDDLYFLVSQLHDTAQACPCKSLVGQSQIWLLPTRLGKFQHPHVFKGL